MAEPTFTRTRIAVTELGENGRFVVRLMVPPRRGWSQIGMHQQFDTRAEAQAYVAMLAVEQQAATLNDHLTAISPVFGRG